DASVVESFDSSKVGHPLRLTVTIKGKREPGYSVPKEVKLTCTRDAGEKCSICPLNKAGGEDTLDVDASDPVILEMAESSKKDVKEIIRKAYGAMKCTKLETDIKKF